MARGPTVFLVLALAVGALALLLVRHQLAAVVLAAALAYLLHPPYAWLLRKVKRPWLASGIVLALVAVALLAPFVFLVLRFMQDAVDIVSDIRSREDVRDRISEMLESFGLSNAQVERFSGRIVEQGAEYLQGQLVPIASMAAGFLVSLAVFFILLFYFLRDGPELVAYLDRVMPAPREAVHRMIERMGERVKAIALGTILVALIQAAIAGVGWWLLGLPAPVFWAAVMLILELVPLVGSFVVLLPAAVWAFAQGDYVAGGGLLVLNFVMVGLIDDVLRPYLIGRRSGVHPALILIGIVGGIPFFGISGIILGPLLMGMLAPLFEAWAQPEDARDPGAPRKKGSHNSS